MARKTIEVNELTRMANAVLASPETTAQSRWAIAGFIEAVLLKSGNYRGFRQLPSEYLPAADQKPGNVLRPDYDPSRRQYH